MDTEIGNGSVDVRTLPHRHAFWALALVLLAGAGFVCLPLVHGVALDVRARRNAAVLLSLSVLFLSGGMGYARAREWGRRVVDATLWSVLVLLSGYLGRLLHVREYASVVMPGVLLYVAVTYRSALWAPEVLKMLGNKRQCAHGDRSHLVLRMLAAILLVAAAAAVAPRWLGR